MSDAVPRGNGAAILPAGSSPAVLSETAPHRRPRFALKRRPQSYLDAFDSRTLFYDCFWHHDGRRVLLVGPPPVNLDYRAVRFAAGPTPLAAQFHTSLSVTVTELRDVPADTREITVAFGGDTLALPIQPNHCAALEGSRVIFTMNKNNDLSWIREWALWHAHHHGADTVVLTDNGSTEYSVSDVRAVLAEVPGIRHVAVHAWPLKYGPVDPAVFANAYWSRFLQVGSMSVALRRYAQLSQGVLNCDIDELAMTGSGTSIFDVARQSRGGLVVFRGTWVEAMPEPHSPEQPPHRYYRRTLGDLKAAHSRQRKWALDPSRAWTRALSIHPYMHWIEGRPRGTKSMPSDATYRHFRGINTNWKVARTTPPTAATMRDAALDAGFEALP